MVEEKEDGKKEQEERRENYNWHVKCMNKFNKKILDFQLSIFLVLDEYVFKELNVFKFA